MGRKYSWQMRLYVIQERDSGKTWRQVEDGLRERFGITKPPTMRMMQKWVKETERKTMSKMLIEQSKKNIPQAGAEAIALFEQKLLPSIWLSIDAGKDMAKVSCMLMISLIEQTFGNVIFEDALLEYTKRRKAAKSS